MIEHFLSISIFIVINSIAILTNLRYIQSERRRHQLLVKEYVTLDRTLDAMSANFEDSARRIEDRERVMQKKLAARAEQLIVMRTARGRNGSIEIARLFMTETDMTFLRGKPGLWGAFAGAVKDTSEAWFYRTVAGGVAV